MWTFLTLEVHKITYRGFPTYMKITITVSTTTFFCLCTCKRGILALVVDPLQSHYYKFHVTVFSKSQNEHKAGNLCSQRYMALILSLIESVSWPSVIYKPHDHYHIFSPLANGLYQEFRREGWTETAIILCKLNKSL